MRHLIKTAIVGLILTHHPAVMWSAESEGPAHFNVGEFKFARPSAWTWIATSSAMRAAQLQVGDPAKSEPAEVVFFYFGQGNGGGTDANIERWLGQFKETKSELKAKVDETKKGGRTVSYVQAEGTYMSGAPLGPKTAKPQFMLHGAILESERGNVFVKMTGPRDLVRSSAKEFRQMVESALP